MATATLRRWDNFQGMVIPSDMCDRPGIAVGDAVEIDEGKGAITVRPRRECTLNALMEGYDGPMPG
ncbi:MAG: hypothetical protein IJG82_08195 [Atopobiaceae bacterium]|nr:hypothetical protein [Atopobiaceae bacterium]